MENCIKEFSINICMIIEVGQALPDKNVIVRQCLTYFFYNEHWKILYIN